MSIPELCDIHHHLVYGVDDGSASLEVSLSMLEKAKKQGVRTIVCTSHISPGRRPYDADAYNSHLEELRKHADGITLLTGSEILYTSKTVKALQEGKVPALNGTDNVLVEFRPDTPYQLIKDAATTIVEAGYNPIIAHVERYACLWEKKRLYELHDEMGVQTQMNASTVLEIRGLFGNRRAKRAIREGLIDIVASDAHNVDSRKCCLGDAYSLLKSVFDADLAYRLCVSAPMQAAGLFK